MIVIDARLARFLDVEQEVEEEDIPRVLHELAKKLITLGDYAEVIPQVYELPEVRALDPEVFSAMRGLLEQVLSDVLPTMTRREYAEYELLGKLKGVKMPEGYT